MTPVGPLMQVREIADYFDVAPATVRRWLNEGNLTGIRVGKHGDWRIPREHLDTFRRDQHNAEDS